MNVGFLLCLEWSVTPRRSSNQDHVAASTTASRGRGHFCVCAQQQEEAWPLFFRPDFRFLEVCKGINVNLTSRGQGSEI